MDKKEILIIYVFGPSRLWQDYINGKVISWLKIGKTSCNYGEDKWEIAAKRINATRHTGIPETSRLYEVFSYPFKNSREDDIFRKILTDDMFTLDNSKAKNKQILDPYEIKAGEEFVYEVTRNQIHNAQAKYEHRLILNNYKKSNKNNLLMDLIVSNHDYSFEDVEVKTHPTSQNSPNSLMVKLCEALPNNIKENTTLYNGEQYRYITIKSNRKGFWYMAALSLRYRQITVAYETYKGEKGRNEIDTLNLDYKNLPIALQQGKKKPEKWSWQVTENLNESEDEVIQWFVDKITKMYSIFEKQE